MQVMMGGNENISGVKFVSLLIATMPVKLITVDFYRVKLEDKESRTFGDLLDEIQEIPSGIKRAQQRTDDAIRLQSVKKGSTTWGAEMLRIRLNELHVKAKLTGEVSELELAEDEGLGEETAFVFYNESGILVVQRNRVGVTASAFSRYVKALCKVRSIAFQPVMKEGALERIQQMQTIRKFEVHFAGVQNGRSLQGSGQSATKMFSILNEFEAPNGTIKVTVGRKPGALRNVLSAVQQLMGSQDEISKIIVAGTEGDADEKAVIDLFEDRLVEIIEVGVNDGKRISSNQRFGALREAWERHNDYLTKYNTP